MHDSPFLDDAFFETMENVNTKGGITIVNYEKKTKVKVDDSRNTSMAFNGVNTRRATCTCNNDA